MTVYSWKCPVCRTIIDAPGQLPCPVCGNMMKKNWASVQLRGAPAFQPHFNHAVGRYVTSSRDFDEALRRGAEESNSTYARIDPGDYPEPTSATESIELSLKEHRDRGLVPPPTSKTIAL